MNIALDPNVSLEAVRGKPFTMTVHVDIGADGKPILVSQHPYRMKMDKLANGEVIWRLERAG